MLMDTIMYIRVRMQGRARIFYEYKYDFSFKYDVISCVCSMRFATIVTCCTMKSNFRETMFAKYKLTLNKITEESFIFNPLSCSKMSATLTTWTCLYLSPCFFPSIRRKRTMWLVKVRETGIYVATFQKCTKMNTMSDWQRLKNKSIYSLFDVNTS